MKAERRYIYHIKVIENQGCRRFGFFYIVKWRQSVTYCKVRTIPCDHFPKLAIYRKYLGRVFSAKERTQSTSFHIQFFFNFGGFSLFLCLITKVKAKFESMKPSALPLKQFQRDVSFVQFSADLQKRVLCKTRLSHTLIDNNRNCGWFGEQDQHIIKGC